MAPIQSECDCKLYCVVDRYWDNLVLCKIAGVVEPVAEAAAVSLVHLDSMQVNSVVTVSLIDGHFSEIPIPSSQKWSNRRM